MNSPLRSLSVVILTLGIGAHPTPVSERQPAALPTELTWLGLYNGALLEWLENANRLDALCGNEGTSGEAADCRTAKMDPKIIMLPARAEPRAEAARLGDVVVVALPGKGLKAFASAGSRSEPFTPDLYDADWGYGPFFHQTVLARRGAWFLVPLPLIGAAWIDPSDWNANAADLVRAIDKGDTITTPRGDMVVLDVADPVLRARRQQKADAPCQEGSPPALAPWTEVRIPFRELFDSRGHLLIHYKYTRGC